MAIRKVVQFGMMEDANELYKTLTIIGQRIAERRKNQNLSQEQLAEIAGLSRDHIAKIEVALKAPSLGTALNIAKALGVELSDLFAGEQAELEGMAQELANLLQTLTVSEAKFIMTLVNETADYLKQHRQASASDD